MARDALTFRHDSFRDFELDLDRFTEEVIPEKVTGLQRVVTLEVRKRQPDPALWRSV